MTDVAPGRAAENMSEHKHMGLIVEDDPEVATLLVQVVRSLGHAARVATTLEDVDAAIAEGGYCYVLLDKQIPATKGSLALASTGNTAQEHLRRAAPSRNVPTEARWNDAHHLPIIVVTKYSRELDFVAENLREGASAFVAKPFDPEKLAAEILAAIARAGVGHEMQRPGKGAFEARSPAAAGGGGDDGRWCARFRLDGLRTGQRTSFVVNEKRRDLQNSKFIVLLRLAAPRFRGSEEEISKHNLGIGRSKEILSRIYEAVETAVPPGFSIVQWGEGGMLRLHPLVKVEHIAYDVLERHPYAPIQKVAAAELRRR